MKRKKGRGNRFGRIVAKRREREAQERALEEQREYALSLLPAPLRAIFEGRDFTFERCRSVVTKSDTVHACAKPHPHEGDHRCACGACWDDVTAQAQLN